jgi:hypothetical protein
MSSIYFECIKENAQPEVAQMNSDKTLKCPATWILKEYGELSNRYYNLGTGYFTQLRHLETVSIPIETKTFKGDKKPVLNYKVSISSVNVTSSFYVYFGTSNPIEITIPANQETSGSIEFLENSKVVRFYILGDDILSVYEDYSIKFNTDEIDAICEFSDFQIDMGLVNSVTIGNTIRQRKVRETNIKYNQPLIIKQSENKQITDVTDFARLNKLKILVYINYSETAGNTIANYPDESGFLDYYYVSHTTTQKTGLYEYISLIVQNNNDNGAR